jgi:pyruvate kinase
MERTRAPGDLQALRRDLRSLQASVRHGQRTALGRWRRSLDGRDCRASAANLAAYLALRGTDIRVLQRDLSLVGLSSLGRMEAHVRSGLAAVASVVDALDGRPPSARRLRRVARLMADQDELLERRTVELLGPSPRGRRTRIMVTLPGAAASDPMLVRALLERGMDVARINAAHDDPGTWRRLAATVRREAAATGRACAVLLDLPGPKMRIDRVLGRPRTVVVTPADGSDVDAFDGVILRPGNEPDDDGGTAAVPSVPVDAAWLDRLGPGDRIDLADVRGRSRVLRVVERTPSGRVRCTVRKTVHLGEGVELVRRPTEADGGAERTVIERLGMRAGQVEVTSGDRILLARGPSSGGAAARPDGQGRPGGPAFRAIIACEESAVGERLAPGRRLLIDDGHIACSVEAVDADGALLVVERTRRPWEPVRVDQGLNVPELELGGGSPTPDDLRILDIAVEIADLVSLSFVESPDDLERLGRELAVRGASRMGVVAKLETPRGVRHLPDILVAGACRGPFGVMIARGDLAVEIGYERLAEMQEELLWLCEAAHVPVIWATQVLETLVKTGIPTRAEVTDAAMAERAECVMLNKGPYLPDGVETLADVLRRMESHQRKKSASLRALRTWQGVVG